MDQVDPLVDMICCKNVSKWDPGCSSKSRVKALDLLLLDGVDPVFPGGGSVRLSIVSSGSIGGQKRVGSPDVESPGYPVHAVGSIDS